MTEPEYEMDAWEDEAAEMADLDPLAGEFNAWLAVAISGLCKDARDRIRMEIRNHYEDGVKALMEEGDTPEDAHDHVMDRLGDANVASKAFHRSYLTPLQERCRVHYTRKSLDSARAGYYLDMATFMLVSMIIAQLVLKDRTFSFQFSKLTQRFDGNLWLFILGCPGLLFAYYRIRQYFSRTNSVPEPIFKKKDTFLYLPLYRKSPGLCVLTAGLILGLWCASIFYEVIGTPRSGLSSYVEIYYVSLPSGYKSNNSNCLQPSSSEIASDCS